ncbi:MAG: hypothetical protein E6H10_11180 [Bacteroidetes bacterium]|nr:MAG: hypothetical protein E6H10_11180 [Bacteroidota bacterium]
MQTLANKITVYTGIEEEKAKAALLIIAAHVKEKYPILRGYADLMLDIKELSLEKDGIVINKFDVN